MEADVAKATTSKLTQAGSIPVTGSEFFSQLIQLWNICFPLEGWGRCAGEEMGLNTSVPGFPDKRSCQHPDALRNTPTASSPARLYLPIPAHRYILHTQPLTTPTNGLHCATSSDVRTLRQTHQTVRYPCDAADFPKWTQQCTVSVYRDGEGRRKRMRA